MDSNCSSTRPTIGFQKIQMDLKTFQRNQQDFVGFRKILRDDKGFQWIPKDSIGFKTISKDLKGFSRIGWVTKNEVWNHKKQGV